MSYGERAALEGLLAALRPRLAVEIGTAEGGSLERIAAYSDEVHSFDLVAPEDRYGSLENVHLHTGDGHVLLREVLAEFAAEGRQVDFALVDGDHSTAGVKQDIEDLLDSPAVQQCVILMHDSVNEEVRRGLELVEWARWEKLQYVQFDFVPGFLFREPMLFELWGGLALAIVDASRRRTADPIHRQFFSNHDLLVAARAQLRDEQPVRTDVDAPSEALRHQLDVASAELTECRDTIERIRTSASWRLTAPLRAAKARLQQRAR
jgi:Methyltransferase domain